VNVKNNKLVIERLTALWALNECGLGGFMHAFGSPFTGIVVGGISILLITLIATHTKKVVPTLIKALSIVLLVKLSVSPHSPITAYIAVSFQAFLGIALYRLFSVNQVTVVLLGLVTFLESALQKLLTLTIIYGQSLWDAVDVYTAWVSDKLAFLEAAISSKTLMLLFITFYACAGVFVGILIIRVRQLIQTVEVSQFNTNLSAQKRTSIEKKPARRLNKLLFFWIITLLLIILPLFYFHNELGGIKKGLYVIARSFLILVLWYTILGPMLLRGLNKLLLKRQSTYKSDIQNTLNLLPYLRSIIRVAWIDSSSLKGLNRVQHFLAKSVVYSIHYNPIEE
jgi:hypothetical protein